TSASRRGSSTPAAVREVTAAASASRTGEAALTTSACRCSSGGLGFQLLPPLLGGKRIRVIVELALQDRLEVVSRQLYAMVGDPPLGEVVSPDLLGALPRPDLRAAIRRQL